MVHTFHIGHREWHFDDRGMGWSDLIVDAAYVLMFLVLLALMLMPYLSLLF